MKNLEQHNFSLENFEGPLDFLLYLIQKNEIDIYNISIQKITEQYGLYLQNLKELCVESGAEFVGLTASLLWMKSKMLLPKHEDDLLEEEELDPEFAIIHHLIDYCRFKEVAKELTERESKQSGFFYRGLDGEEKGPKKPLGIDHLSIEDLAGVFRELLKNAAKNKGTIEREVWQVSDKIHEIRDLLKENSAIPLDRLFSFGQCREEIIVTFLAILELMKLGEIQVVKESDSHRIIIHRVGSK